MGLNDVQIDELAHTKKPNNRLTILAPAGGVVHALRVREGQYVSEGDVFMELVDMSHLWVFADLFEEEVPMAELGMPVDVTVGHLPGESFSGEVRFIDHMVKPGTRTVPIRVDVRNDGHRLKAGMYVRVLARHEGMAVTAIPEDAVLWSGKRAVAIVKEGDGVFQPREVQLGRKWMLASSDEQSRDNNLGFGSEHRRYHEVLAGLLPGDEVVTSGAFLLNSESQFQGVLTKLLPPESERATLEQVVGRTVAAKIRGVLDAYFRLSQSLADDRLDDVPAKWTALTIAANQMAQIASEEGSSKLADNARVFHELLEELSSEPATDAREVRTRFGRISRELTTLLVSNGGKTLFGKDLYQFECGMAKVGYERWLWWSPEVHNPYMGHKMLKCGRLLKVLQP